MPDTTHEGNDPMGALTTHRGPLDTCPAPECQDRIIEQQDETPAGQRQLNACGFSVETIAAEYETDAVLAEAGLNMADPYFRAAFAAEDAHRMLDQTEADRA